MRGTIKGLMPDYEKRGNYLLTLSLTGTDAETLEEYRDKILNIKISEWREPRSRNANSYFHVLVNKLAKVVNPPVSENYMKNLMIIQYGQPMMLPDSDYPATVKTNVSEDLMMEMPEPHCKRIRVKNEEDNVYWYMLYRGSHTYNTKEMSVLIDGTVEECKRWGIETLTPNELERLKQSWKQ